jgi:hypothetical protein
MSRGAGDGFGDCWADDVEPEGDWSPRLAGLEVSGDRGVGETGAPSGSDTLIDGAPLEWSAPFAAAAAPVARDREGWGVLSEVSSVVGSGESFVSFASFAPLSFFAFLDGCWPI